MDAISSDPVAYPSREEVSLRAVTGRRRRRFSLPALPAQQLCLELNPHDARPTRKAVRSPLGRKTSIDKMAELAAKWKADAAHRLSILPESFAHIEAMRLQEASQGVFPTIAAAKSAPRPSRNDVRGPPRGSLRRETRRVLGMSRSLPLLSMPPTPAMVKGVTFALPDHVEGPRAIRGEQGLPPAPSGPPNASESCVEEPHVACPPRKSPAPAIARPSSPGPESGTEAPKSTSMESDPTMLTGQDLLKEAAQPVAASVVPEIRTDSVIEAIADGQQAALTADVVQGSAPGGELPQDGIDEEEIAASFLGYQAFLEDDKDVDRGRRRDRGE